MGPWQVSPQKWRLSLFAFLRTWSSLRRSSITCGLHGTKLQILQSNFNSSLIQFQWQTSLQCHILSCSIYFRDPSDIVCSVWYSNVLWTPCPGTRLQRESWKLRMIWNSSFLQTFSGNLRCMDLTFSKRTKTISRDPYTHRKMLALYDYTSAKKILKCAGPQVVPTNMQKTSKTTYVRSTSTRLAGPLTTWVAKRRRPVSSSGDQWRQRTFLSEPNCKIWSMQRMILHVLYLNELHSGTTWY